MKIAFFSSEVAPFVKTGGLGEVCGSLPLALEQLGQDIIIFLPYYKCIKEKEFKLKRINRFVSTINIGRKVRVFFIENDEYFNREELYGYSSGDFQDNLERFQFFCFKSLKVLKQLELKVNIVHCHDWQTALIPVYLKYLFSDDPFFLKSKAVLTIHNLAYQGIFPKGKFEKLHLKAELFHNNGFEFYDRINFLKAGIVNSDMVTTVSPRYAQEIQTKAFGCGLEGVLRFRKDHLVGILNGIDYTIWNPQSDPLIGYNYSAKDLSLKRENKNLIRKMCQWSNREDIPLFGFVGRLSQQKGLDLLLESFKELFHKELQVIFLGVGEQEYFDQLKEYQRRYPKKMSVHFKFDEKLAHQIFAGSDFFLMPSVFEPCGLSQMISLKYGTIPIVFRTGGLADTISPYQHNGNGFIFTEYNKKDFLKVIDEAMRVYVNKHNFEELIRKALSSNFSWENSAQRYLAVYTQCLAG